MVDASVAGAGSERVGKVGAVEVGTGALGFVARHLGIDSEHTRDEPSTHHGVADVWVDSLRKWVVMDPKYDVHYLLDGIPLNAEEIGRRWRSHRGGGIQASVGPERRPVTGANAECLPDSHESRCYFWHYIDAQNDVFHHKAQQWPDPAIFLVDDERKKQTWYQGAPPNAYPHGRYANQSWVVTERYDDAYPDLNCVDLQPSACKLVPMTVRVAFGPTCVPNLSHHLISIDGGSEWRFDGVEFPWRLHGGRCSVTARAVNACGLKGPPSAITVVVDDRSGGR
jgi:hypothetical protein